MWPKIIIGIFFEINHSYFTFAFGNIFYSNLFRLIIYCFMFFDKCHAVNFIQVAIAYLLKFIDLIFQENFLLSAMMERAE